MILLDPELDPDPAPKATSARRRSVFSTSTIAPLAHVPSVRALRRFLTEAQEAVPLRERVSVLLTTDRTLRRLNRQFRSIDKPTDVLSFPAETFIQDKEKIAGDLAISVPAARRQAAACGHSLRTELKVLILHGLLHLAGYDHESDSGQMARREQRLREKLGLPQGLIERVEMKSTRQPIPRKVGRTAGAPTADSRTAGGTAGKRRP